MHDPACVQLDVNDTQFAFGVNAVSRPDLCYVYIPLKSFISKDVPPSYFD